MGSPKKVQRFEQLGPTHLIQSGQFSFQRFGKGYPYRSAGSSGTQPLLPAPRQLKLLAFGSGEEEVHYSISKTIFGC